MPITSVRYSVEFNVNGLKRWLGAEATVPEGASEDAELDLILDFIKRTDQRVHGAQPIAGPQPPEPKELPTLNIDRPIGRDEILEGIKAAADATDLNGYKLLVKNNVVWKTAYELRLQQLGLIG